MPSHRQLDHYLAEGRYDLALEAASVIGFSQGAAAERERTRAILESENAIGREGTAVHIVTKTDFTAIEAELVLATVPASSSPARNVRAIAADRPKLICHNIGE